MESKDLKALSELYLQTVHEDKKYGYDKDGNSLNPVDIEKREKEDDDLAGSPNKNGKKNGKKAKRWWDDDGDGKGYEKGEVDGKFPDKDGSKKKKVKEEVEIEEKKMIKVKLNPKKKIGVKVTEIGAGGKEYVTKNTMDEAVYGGKKEASKDNRMVLTRADKKANTPAWQNRDKKNPKTGKSVYKMADHLKNEEVEIDPGMEHNLSVLRMLAEKEVDVKDTKKVVDAIRAYDKSKDASRDATDDSDKGDKEGAAIEKKYAAKERGEIKKDDPNWKNKKYHTGMHGEEVESLVASGKFSNEELMSIANLQEADIADILARLEKKRISKGGDPDESPLGKKTGRAMKAQQDKQRKKAGLKTEHHQVDADGNVIEHEEEEVKK